jgi:hypothetical protein
LALIEALGPNDQALQKKKKKEWLDQTGRHFIFRVYRLCKFPKYGQLECWTPNANGVFSTAKWDKLNGSWPLSCTDND